MFNQNNEEKKLDWMYKGPNSTVEREEYLLGRSVDKTLEQLNEEEKQKQQGVVATPKNRVEHECIPPSIRDFNKVVQAEQVDLSAKLQEDPLVAIKKREEESRRQFLQNPVQLKKLQKALKAQQAKKNKKKKKKAKDDSDIDLDVKLTEKLLGKKSKKISKEERDLDTILIHKYEEFKDQITDSDIRDILDGKFTDSEDDSDCDSSSEEEKSKKKAKKKKKKTKAKKCESSDDESEDDKKRQKNKHSNSKNYESKKKYSSDDDAKYERKRRDPDRRRYDVQERQSNSKNERSRHHSRSLMRYRDSDKTKTATKQRARSSSLSSSSSEDTKKRHSRDNGSDSDSPREKKRNYGLVNSEGKKLSLKKNSSKAETEYKPKPAKEVEAPKPVQKHRAKRLTEEEKNKLRREMMENAVRRDKERSHYVKKYRENEEKEAKQQDFDPEFVHKQLLKTTQTSSVESRIKSNLNNIQRSSRDMNRNFSRR